MAGFEASAANHHRGDSFGSQNRYEPSPNIRLDISGNATQKVEQVTAGCLEKLEFLFEDKAGEHYNRRNINHISRIIM